MVVCKHVIAISYELSCIFCVRPRSAASQHCVSMHCAFATCVQLSSERAAGAGTIDMSLLGGIPSLEEVDFTNSRLQGSLPADVGLDLPNLRALVLARTHLKGPIPEGDRSCDACLPCGAIGGRNTTLQNKQRSRICHMPHSQIP